ncbi:selenium-dependent molybdenum cofactor biosynthesis protein YqeB [Marinisporobacter balticus]|uniref:Xanthine dehydrogenase accessory factor n=1 Tax=Marinisporobacter balticus TaxID=2018667 RepID=A0A4R2KUH9_9FIRM|nr:selenium-dependent molybdenum cofactor biosynthesis protein YqeB [Marinisporobacter balticus]TCO74779.1 xanthine dehydrogenase accessory factor [Marinisporobacter balticus]
MFSNIKVIVKGGGDLASAVIHKLFQVGFLVIVTELKKPMMVRRTVSFANCIYEKEWTVEGVTAVFVEKDEAVEKMVKQRKIPVVIDSSCNIKNVIKPHIIIDATLAKRNLGTKIDDAPIVIGLGPGFTAKVDVDAVIETMRGHNLGRVIFRGCAVSNTGIPGNINGYTSERVLRAPCEGIVKNSRKIGDRVKRGETIGCVGDEVIKASIDGVLRGLIHHGLFVKRNEKIGDIDPRGEKDNCFSISDKGRNIAGGVLEAVLILLGKEEKYQDERRKNYI